MTDHSDPLDDVLREAHRRGQVVLWHPLAGPVFVTATIATEHTIVDPKALGAIERLDATALPAVARTKGTA